MAERCSEPEQLPARHLSRGGTVEQIEREADEAIAELEGSNPEEESLPLCPPNSGSQGWKAKISRKSYGDVP